MTTTIARLSLALAACLPLHAAPSLLINFSSADTNDLTPAEAAATGADAYTNVRTGSVNPAGATAAISLDGVTGSVVYPDYFQQNQKSHLGQPYATLIGAARIGSSGNSVTLSLDLSQWLAANGFSSYQVTLYYAGRSASSEALMTDSTPDVFFNETKSDIVFVTGRHSSGYWKGNGQTHAFTGSDLAIRMNYLGEKQEAGVCAVRIDGVAQPHGLWLFDDEQNPGKATIGADLAIVGSAPAWEAVVADGRDSPMPLQGVITTRHGTGNHLLATHNIGANGGGTYTNEYTLVYDVMIPDAGGQWRAFYQTRMNNSDDAEMFVRNSNNTIGRATVGYSGSGLQARRWHRLAFSVDLKTSGFLRSYLDGRLFHNHTKPALDGDYSLNASQVLLFADNDGENHPLTIGMAAVYGRALSSGQIASLGGPGMAVLPNPDNQAPSVIAADAGDAEGPTGQELEYVFSAGDPDGDLVQLQVDWGGGALSDWSGFTTPGEPAVFRHIWNLAGSYTLKARARDIYGAVSVWTDIQTITASGPSVITFSTPPYLQNMSVSGMVVMAEILENIPLSLEYGENFEHSAPCESVASGGGTWFVRAVLSGLQEDRAYNYRFRQADGGEIIPSPAGSLVNQPGTFRTATSEHRDFSFGSIGDVQRAGNGGAWDADVLEPAKSMLAHMAASGVSFGIGTGDQAENGDSYTTTKQSYLMRMAEKLGVTVPYYISWGNHDVRGANTPLRLAADMPSRHRTDSPSLHGPGTGSFAFEYAGVYFVCIDYYSIFDGINPVFFNRPENELTNGYIESLLAADAAKDARFRVVAVHVPPFGEVWRDGDENLRRDLVPLLEKYNTNLVLSGHMHGYERGYLNGITYITSGGGSYLDHGVAIVRDWPHIVMGGHSPVPGTYAIQSSRGVLGPPKPIVNGMFHHYLKIDVTDEQMLVQALGFNADGSYIGVIDSTRVLRDVHQDSDGDGLPDAWEIANGLDPEDPTGEHGAEGDPDNDGFSNLHEYRSGTDPRSARVNFKLTANDIQPDLWQVSWSTAFGKKYRIYISEDLAEWRPLQQDGKDVVFTGTGQTISHSFPTPASGKAFLRIEAGD